MNRLVYFLKSNYDQPDLGWMGEVSDVLWHLFGADKDLWTDLFVRGVTLNPSSHISSRDGLSILVKAGVLVESLRGVKSQVMILPVKDKLIATDFPDVKRADMVFPIHPESLYLIENMDVAKTDSVLDVATGSGILGIFAAEKGCHVVATDINRRALLFAAFNGSLNGVREKFELFKGDLVKPVSGRHFDFVCANLPFEPVPPGFRYYIHSDGGKDGLSQVRRLLNQVRSQRVTFEAMRMIAFSVGDQKRILLEQSLLNLCREVSVKVEVRVLANAMNLAEFTQRFRAARGFADWHSTLLERGWNSLYYLTVGISPGTEFSYTRIEDLSQEGIRWDIPCAWHSWVGAERAA